MEDRPTRVEVELRVSAVERRQAEQATQVAVIETMVGSMNEKLTEIGVDVKQLLIQRKGPR